MFSSTAASGMLLLFNPLASRDSTDHFPGHGSFGPGHVAFAVRGGYARLARSAKC